MVRPNHAMAPFRNLPVNGAPTGLDSLRDIFDLLREKANGSAQLEHRASLSSEDEDGF